MKTKLLEDKDLSNRPLLDSGSTLLNLALTDTARGGYCGGTINNIVGDSSAGKTFLVLTALALAAKNELFKDHLHIYDDAERALKIKMSLFGNHNIVVPEFFSRTIGDFYHRMLFLAFEKKETSFLYALDSLDSLKIPVTKEDMAKDPQKGGWKTDIPIILTDLFNKINDPISDTDSVLFIVSQTRDNLGVSVGPKKRRSGGHALRFYSTQEIWLHVVNKIWKGSENRKKEIGVVVQARIKKNKVTGKLRNVEFPIFYDYGVDDITSMIRWMVHEEFWAKPKGKQKINTGKDFGELTEPKLIEKIEKEDLYENLRDIVQECWNEIEESLKVDRIPRF